jgi:hypothetical protein
MHAIQCKLPSMIKSFNLFSVTTRSSLRTFFGIASLLVVFSMTAQEVPRDTSFSAWKINLVDMISGEWNVARENAWKENLTVQWMGGLLLKDDRLATEELAFYFNEWGDWSAISAECDARHLAANWSVSIRDYKKSLSNTGNAIYTAAKLGHRFTRVDLEESIASPADAFSAWYGVLSTDPMIHSMRMHEISLGLELGTQWRMRNGWLLEAFANPSVRLVVRNFEPSGPEQFDALTARSAQQKLQQRYSAGRKLSNSYSAKTGPWVQFGLILGVFANEKQ